MLRGLFIAMVMALGLTVMAPSDAKADFSASLEGSFVMGFGDNYANDPCPPDRRRSLDERIANAVAKYIEMIPLSFIEPGHVKQVVDCLADLMNIGITVSAIFNLNWQALLSNILSDLINRACQAATRAVDEVVSQIQANIQFPDITVDILGENVTLFGGSLSGGLTRGAPMGQIDIQLNSPIGRDRVILNPLQ
ncbi:MAG: hypothetical protein KI792_03665 [Alphaproteobacteria bacterium]|nr:hypothetical protein [Alphaproteobacteria bacterium SS10]